METNTNTWTIEFPAYRVGEFNNMVGKANRRLAKAGATVTFSPSITEFTKRVAKGGVEVDGVWLIQPTWVEEPWVRAELDDIRLSLGDYTFCAALVAEEAGYTVHTAPGQDLSEWKRPAVDDMHCDHCGTKRFRNRLYVVRDNQTGKLFQLGHNCIELYTGMKPKGLSALLFDTELRAFADEDSGAGFSHRDYGVEVRKVLAYAWTFSDHGRSYVSKAQARWDGNATADVVRTALFVTPRPPYRATPQQMADYRAYLEQLKEADRCYREDGDLLDRIIAISETIDATSDYGQNLAVILAGEYVSGRNVGILASLVSVYARELELAVKRAEKASAATGFLAEPKVRIKEQLRVTLETVRYWEGDYGTTTFMVGRTESQHTVVWKASGTYDVEPGDVLVLSAATVKAHEQYKGIDQTVLTRCKVEEIKHPVSA